MSGSSEGGTPALEGGGLALGSVAAVSVAGVTGSALAISVAGSSAGLMVDSTREGAVWVLSATVALSDGAIGGGGVGSRLGSSLMGEGLGADCEIGAGGCGTVGGAGDSVCPEISRLSVFFGKKFRAAKAAILIRASTPSARATLERLRRFGGGGFVRRYSSVCSEEVSSVCCWSKEVECGERWCQISSVTSSKEGGNVEWDG